MFITIGLIPYNGEATVAEALDSLLAQTHSDFELIISDDASTDHTVEICKRYSKKDPRIRLFVQKKNLGLAGNSNFVLSKGRGSFFMWAADDDLWDRTYIETLLKLHAKYHDVALAVSNLRVFKEGDSRYVDSTLRFPEYSSGMDLLTHFLSEPALLVWGIFRTDVLRRSGGFHEDGRPFFGGSDFVTNWKVFLQGKGLTVSKKRLLFKRDTGSTLARFDGLTSRHIDWHIMKKIGRYLMYPYMFTLDAACLLRALTNARLPFKEKIMLSGYILRWFLLINLDLLSLVWRGVRSVAAGITSSRHVSQ